MGKRRRKESAQKPVTDMTRAITMKAATVLGSSCVSTKNAPGVGSMV